MIYSMKKPRNDVMQLCVLFKLQYCDNVHVKKVTRQGNEPQCPESIQKSNFFREKSKQHCPKNCSPNVKLKKFLKLMY